MSEISKDIADTVDVNTKLRAAYLSSRGMLDGQIADILLLTDEQMRAVKNSAEFKEKYAEEANATIDAQIAREEGWDTLEDEALFNLIQSMKYNKDPKFMLQVAMASNRAERRAKKGDVAPQVIDASDKGKNNIIILNLNKNYISKSGEDKQIDVTPRPSQIPLKQSDIPSPKTVDALLAPARERAELSTVDKQMSDIEKMARAAGVVFDES